MSVLELIVYTCRTSFPRLIKKFEDGSYKVVSLPATLKDR